MVGAEGEFFLLVNAPYERYKDRQEWKPQNKDTNIFN